MPRRRHSKSKKNKRTRSRSHSRRSKSKSRRSRGGARRLKSKRRRRKRKGKRRKRANKSPRSSSTRNRRSKRKSKSRRRGNTPSMFVPFVSEKYVVRQRVDLVRNGLYVKNSMQTVQDALKRSYVENKEIVQQDEDDAFDVPQKTFQYLTPTTDTDGSEHKLRLRYIVEYTAVYPQNYPNDPVTREHRYSWRTNVTPTFQAYYEYKQGEHKRVLNEDEEYTEDDFQRNGRHKRPGEKIMEQEEQEYNPRGTGRLLLRVNEQLGSSHFNFMVRTNRFGQEHFLSRIINKFDIDPQFGSGVPRELWGHPQANVGHLHVQYYLNSLLLTGEQVRNVNISVTIERSSNKTVQAVKEVSKYYNALGKTLEKS